MVSDIARAMESGFNSNEDSQKNKRKKGGRKGRREKSTSRETIILCNIKARLLRNSKYLSSRKLRFPTRPGKPHLDWGSNTAIGCVVFWSLMKFSAPWMLVSALVAREYPYVLLFCGKWYRSTRKYLLPPCLPDPPALTTLEARLTSNQRLLW